MLYVGSHMSMPWRSRAWAARIMSPHVSPIVTTFLLYRTRCLARSNPAVLSPFFALATRGARFFPQVPMEKGWARAANSGYGLAQHASSRDRTYRIAHAHVLTMGLLPLRARRPMVVAAESFARATLHLVKRVAIYSLPRAAAATISLHYLGWLLH